MIWVTEEERVTEVSSKLRKWCCYLGMDVERGELVKKKIISLLDLSRLRCQQDQDLALPTTGTLEEAKILQGKQKSRILFIKHLKYAIPEGGMLHQYFQLMQP